jgi:folate-binding Fe-S cluster repair protein YgfZ
MDSLTDTVTDTNVHWASITATGPEAEGFLQGQLSQDLATVPSSGVLALVLAPDGVVITSGHVTAVPDGYVLTIPLELAEVTLARLSRFLLRTKCTLAMSDVDHGPYDTLSEQIQAGVPGPSEFAWGLTPQCFGGSFVASTVSFTKGCFTGQELVGRLDARGSSVPWRLVRATGPSEARVNEVLRARGPAGPSGLTTTVRTGESVAGLGFAHRTLFASEELAGVLDVHVEEIV